MFDGLKMWPPRHVITYFESSDTAAVPTKIHQPCMLHQSPCCVPGTRRMNATPFPVSSALAGHISTCCLRAVIAISSTAQVRERRAGSARSRRGSGTPTCPSTCSEMITAARCSRGSLSFGRTIGIALSPPLISGIDPRCEARACPGDRRLVVLETPPAPVSVFVADAHGELVAAATMDGAAPDTRLNAQRKAYTAARSDARTTRELAEKVGRRGRAPRASTRSSRSSSAASPSSRATTRIGAVGVSGLPGEVDESLALRRYRTIRGSVKTSYSSRLRVENSETTAPSAPAWNQCSVSGGIVNCSPGAAYDLAVAVDVEVHRRPCRQRNVSSLPGSSPTGGWRCSGQTCCGKSTSSFAQTRVGVHVDDELQPDLLEPAEPEVGHLDAARARRASARCPRRASIAAARSRASASVTA